MASRLLLKMKLNANLPLRFIRNPPSSILTQFVAPIAQPGALQSNNSALLGMTQNLFARQMGTSRSSSTPCGNPKVSDEEDIDDFDDEDEDDDDVDFDDGDIDTLDLDENDLDDDDEEEQEPPRKK